MSQIITYLLIYNQYLINQIYELTIFIAKHIPIKQWAFEDSNSPVYQKFKVDKLPIIKKFIKQDYSFLLDYYLWNTVNLLNLFNVVTERPFQKVSYVLIVEHLITLSMITMVAKVNINAKYVVKHL